MKVIFYFTVCVYVNSGCFCGNLSIRKVKTLPSKFGPNRLSLVLSETVQAVINASSDERKVYNLVKEGSGKVSVSGKLEDITFSF